MGYWGSLIYVEVTYRRSATYIEVAYMEEFFPGKNYIQAAYDKMDIAYVQHYLCTRRDGRYGAKKNQKG